MIAAGVACGIGLGLGGVAFEPTADIVVVALFAPQQAGEGLTLNIARVFGLFGIDAFGVKFVGFFDALIEDLLESRTKELQRAGVAGGQILICKAKTYRPTFSRSDFRRKMGCCFGPGQFRIHRATFAIDNIAVERVFHERSRAFRIKQPLHIGFVFGEKRFGSSLDQQPAFTVVKLGQFEELGAVDRIDRRNLWPFVLISPVPAISKPNRREQMQAGRIGSAIPGGNANQNILEIRFGILHENVEVTVVPKDSGIDQLVLGVFAGSLAVFNQKLLVWKFALWVFVHIFQVRAGRRSIKVVVILFYILAVIPFPVVKPKKALFEDRIFLIPHGQRKTDVLVTVAETGDAVFAPAVGPGTGVIVRQIVPGIAIRAVIFADGAPLAFGEIGSPTLPMDCSISARLESF